MASAGTSVVFNSVTQNQIFLGSNEQHRQYWDNSLSHQLDWSVLRRSFRELDVARLAKDYTHPDINNCGVNLGLDSNHKDLIPPFHYD